MAIKLPILLAVAPFFTTLSAPTTTQSTFPSFIKLPAIESLIKIPGSPSLTAS